MRGLSLAHDLGQPCTIFAVVGGARRAGEAGRVRVDHHQRVPGADFGRGVGHLVFGSPPRLSLRAHLH
jgi:hypothetical protein